MNTELFEYHTFQILMLGISSLGTLALFLFGIILKQFSKNQEVQNKHMEKVVENLTNLNNMVLKHYVTKDELETIEKFCHRGIHDNRDDIHYHDVAITLLARHSKIELPIRPQKPAR